MYKNVSKMLLNTALPLVESLKLDDVLYILMKTYFLFKHSMFLFSLISAWQSWQRSILGDELTESGWKVCYEARKRIEEALKMTIAKHGNLAENTIGTVQKLETNLRVRLI